jgi:hypothetical protein
MARRRVPIEEGFRHPGDFGQGPRFPGGFAESRVPAADASYQGYGAYASLDGSRVDDSEYADLDYTGVELEQELRRSHRGRGPRGYRRSDESIADDLHVILTAHPDIDASDVEVHVANGEVLLRGTVRDRATKRLIEDVAYQIAGVLDVNNALRIGPPPPAPQPERFADDEVESKPRSTAKDDHPSRRDALTTEHLRDAGSMQDQFDRRIDRANLRDHDYVGPRDTSAGERLSPPEEPLFTPSARPRGPRTVEQEEALEELDDEGLTEEEGGGT